MTDRAMVDRNGVRGGAGISAVLLLVAFIVQWRPAVPILAVVLGIGSIFGLRYSPLGAAYRLLKRTLHLSVPVEPEEAAPPRFAQTLGFVVLGLSTAVLYVAESSTGEWIGWALALAVAGLQTLLATTGICVGCEIYLLSRRLSARSA